MVRSEAPRPHRYEIDLMRVVTALCVVAIHATSSTIFLAPSPLASQLQNGAVITLQLTREVFLGITAFVLVYVYTGRSCRPGAFWRKRGLSVLLPYVVWSLIYAWRNIPHEPLLSWLQTALTEVMAGSASYQLYFILLVLEFYLLLPAFLWFIEKVGRRHPWPLLVCSGFFQLAMLYTHHSYIQTAPFANTPLGQFVNANQSSFLPLYQFYLVLGGVAALHADSLRAFIVRRGHLAIGAGLASLGLLWLRYGVAVWVQHQPEGYAVTAFQPTMVVYSAAGMLFMYWLGVSWDGQTYPGRPPAYWFWTLLSEASFGIYLIHPLVLEWVLAVFLPLLPADLPSPVLVLMVWLLTSGLTTAISVALLHVPSLSWLVGHPASWSILSRRVLLAGPLIPQPSEANGRWQRIPSQRPGSSAMRRSGVATRASDPEMREG